MEQDQKRTYEGMFLLDAGQDFEAASEPVRNVLERYGAELTSIKPWDERKLAYPIDGRKRGLYVLAYFSLDPSQVGEIEHDCQLDERILRALLLRKDSISAEEMQADTPALVSARKTEKEQAEKQKRAEESAAAAEKKSPPAAEGEGEKKPAPTPEAKGAEGEKEPAGKGEAPSESKEAAEGGEKAESGEETSGASEDASQDRQ